MSGKPMRILYPDATPLSLAKSGFTFAAVGEYFSLSEAQAEKIVTCQRSAALGLPSPYEQV